MYRDGIIYRLVWILREWLTKICFWLCAILIMNRKQVAKLILFPLILGCSIVALDRFLFKNVGDDLNSYSQFYKEEQDACDIVLVGNSTLREGYIPTQMWHNYHITSRAFTSSPTHPEVIKVALKEIIKKQHPKMMFIDINGLTFQKEEDAEFFIKQYYKAVEDKEHKEELLAQYDYLKEEEDNFELFKNHNNFRQQQYWESLVYYDQFKTKGYYPHQVITKVKPLEYDSTTTSALPKDGEEYYTAIMDVCEQYKNDIQFVFGKTPRFMTNQTQIEDTYMLRSKKEDIESRGFIFHDFSEDVTAIGLDPNSDFKDYDHLNHLGSIKFTEYFGKYVTNDLSFTPSEYKQETIDNFDTAYTKTEKYLADIEKRLLKLAHK